uniref:Uncharacterized protein n=1 Tax=Glossina pallidipes TaxID=7398 RepID=A0A1A9Z7B6_GLOPL
MTFGALFVPLLTQGVTYGFGIHGGSTTGSDSIPIFGDGKKAKYLQSASISLLSLVLRRSFKDRLLNEPPVVVAVPRRSKKGLTAEAVGRRARTIESTTEFESVCWGGGGSNDMMILQLILILLRPDELFAQNRHFEVNRYCSMDFVLLSPPSESISSVEPTSSSTHSSAAYNKIHCIVYNSFVSTAPIACMSLTRLCNKAATQCITCGRAACNKRHLGIAPNALVNGGDKPN